MAPQYAQKYRKEWEKHSALQDWIEPSTTNRQKSYCKYCKVLLSSKLGDLLKHAQTGKHVSASKPFSCKRQQQLSFQPTVEVKKQQRKEAQLCIYVAMHASILTIDHLSDLHKDTSLDIKIHRTKCTNIINNIIGPYFYDSLIKDVGDGYYSLLIDESTDITVNKMLGIAIRYYSQDNMRIVSTFLGLIHIQDGTAECIVLAIKKILSDVKLKLTNLQGLGTDNASAMVGVNAGVYAILKVDVPHLVLIRCVCHSLQLAVSKATENTLPRNIEFQIKETYNWFAHSSMRQLSYAEIYGAINDGEKPLKIVRMADTRWLSIEPAVKRILDQWISLRTHFEITRIKDNCYTAELLHSMYCDKKNFVFLSFLHPILSLVQKTNKSFESQVADPTKLLTDLKMLYSIVVSKIVLPTARIDIYEQDIDKYLDPTPTLGFAFESAYSENGINGQEKDHLKSRCISFLVALARELKNRMPENIKILERMNILSVSECLKPNKVSITDLATYYTTKDIRTIITKIEFEWDNIRFVNWKETQDTEKFWVEVSNYRDASGQNPFKQLVDLAFKVLCLPHSNADIERVFSQMNLIKTKLRNRMKLKLLNNILHIRFGLKRLGLCCNNYTLPDHILKNIGTIKAWHQTDGPDEQHDQAEIEELDQLFL